MQRYLFQIDRISEWTGKLFAWCILILTAVVCYDVAARYLFRAPFSWAYDIEYILYGALFMMAGAYTLARNGHVRGDVLYGFFPPRVQAGLDLTLYFLFFIPGIAALGYAGVDFARVSWDLGERSGVTVGGPPLYHFKTLIPIAGVLVLLQGVAEIVRCVQCLRTGEWPKRAHDVEEVDVEELKKMVHAENIETEDVRFTEGTPPDLLSPADGSARKGEDGK
jgi:TRAP-type mannitol/chloroaromatic compound transport system permease small subunit